MKTIKFLKWLRMKLSFIFGIMTILGGAVVIIFSRSGGIIGIVPIISGSLLLSYAYKDAREW